MATGVSPLYYPDQPKPNFNLEIDNSYFLVKLHDTQAFFQANWLAKPGLLILSSSVESSFQPNSPTQSLHKVSTLQKNIPCRLGISTNLTDWLPVRSGNSLRISINYTVFQDKPILNFITQMEQADLVAKLSLKPDWAVALKVSNVVGKLLSYLVQEDKQHDIFSLTMDLNVADLKTGYYIAYGSHSDEIWTSPQFLKIDTNGRLIDKTLEDALSRLSYAVIRVLGIKRFQQEVFRDQPWWQLLQTVKSNIIYSDPVSDLERRKLVGEWFFALKHIREWALKRYEYLWSEIQEMIAAAQVEVDKKLKPATRAEGYGIDNELPDELQDILGVETEEELQNLVRDYQDALEISQRLLEQYNL